MDFTLSPEIEDYRQRIHAFVAMLLAVPLFGAMVARFPRRRFVPLAYRVFIACIVAFFVVLSMADTKDR